MLSVVVTPRNTVRLWLDANQCPQHQLPLDNHGDDTESLRSQSVASSTTSLRESILEYRKLFGRTYHHEYGDAESWIPNDDKHRECMELG